MSYGSEHEPRTGIDPNDMTTPTNERFRRTFEAFESYAEASDLTYEDYPADLFRIQALLRHAQNVLPADDDNLDPWYMVESEKFTIPAVSLPDNT